MIYPYLNRGNLVVLESTVSPGTCEKLLVPILERSGLKGNRRLLFGALPREGDTR